MSKHARILGVLLGSVFAMHSVAATNQAVQVLREGGIAMYMNIVVVLASVTCLTFIFVLLACGFEEPVI